MSDDVDTLRQDCLAALAEATDQRAWDAIRVSFLGKSGRLTGLLKQLGRMDAEERKVRGAQLNRLRDELTRAIEDRGREIETAALDARLAAERVDISVPVVEAARGGLHPVSQAVEEITAIFGAMGFTVAEGPDIETDWHNFSALNTPEHHAARTRPRHVLPAARRR